LKERRRRNFFPRLHCECYLLQHP